MGEHQCAESRPLLGVARPQHAMKGRLGWAMAALVAAVGYPSQASAYCRTTTCNPAEESCPVHPTTGCGLSGIPLYWPDTCVTFGVHRAGSALRGISFTEAQDAAERAFQTWISTECTSGMQPSIGVVALGEIECDKVEYNYPTLEQPDLVTAPNVNLIVFRDTAWPYLDDDEDDGRQTLALTTITYGTRTGEILDADIEVNSLNTALSTGDRNITNDLQSILAHEVGHFFGLAHSKVADATMNPRYNVNVADTTFRTLSEDDRNGICEIYPPGAVAVGECRGEGPRFGFSRYCAEQVQASAGLLCSHTPGRPASRSSLGIWLLAAGIAAGGMRQALRRRAATA